MKYSKGFTTIKFNNYEVLRYNSSLISSQCLMAINKEAKSMLNSTYVSYFICCHMLRIRGCIGSWTDPLSGSYPVEMQRNIMLSLSISMKVLENKFRFHVKSKMSIIFFININFCQMSCCVLLTKLFLISFDIEIT